MDYESFKLMCLERSANDAGYAIAYAALIAGESQRRSSDGGKSTARAAQIKSLSLPFSADDRLQMLGWLDGRKEVCLPDVWLHALKRPKEEYRNLANVLALSALMQSIGWRKSGRRTRAFGHGLQMIYMPAAHDEDLEGLLG